MSIIMPSGSNKIEWSPKEDKLNKTASTGDVQEEINPLYEAAKEVIAASKKKVCEECKCCPCECKKDSEKDGVKEAAGACMDDEEVVIEVDEVKENDNAEAKIDDVADKKSVSESVKEIEDQASKAEQVVEKVEECVEKIEEAVADVKDAVASGAVEIKDEATEIPGETKIDDEVIVEGIEAKSDAGMSKSASEEEFCRFAKLSASNKKKLVDYWTNMLNYPKDYVALMVKDYEK